MTSLRDRYRDATVFVTGVTGFLGKVLLEKIARSLPDVRRIVVLIRNGAARRLEEELLSSPIWDRLKSERGPDYETWIRTKILALEGDVTEVNCGLNPEDLAYVCREVNVVIHCAASIDFRERLDHAVTKNITGVLRVMDLARSMQNLKAFVHCSTAYVNAHLPEGHAPEAVPRFKHDIEKTIEKIQAIDSADIDRFESKFLGRYPNSYTYTKALGEAMLERKRGSLPVVIVRPSIIGGSHAEPYPGWCDSVQAIAAVIVYHGVGLVSFMKGNINGVADIVPVDFVANALIAAVNTVWEQDRLEVLNCGTSCANPVRWSTFEETVAPYWNTHPPRQRIMHPKPYFLMCGPLEFNIRFFFTYSVPAWLAQLLAWITRMKGHAKNASLLARLRHSVNLITDTFQHFTSNTWFFDTTNYYKLYDSLNEEDRKTFYLDFKVIEWREWTFNYTYGLAKFVLKDDAPIPPSELFNSNLMLRDEVWTRGFLHYLVKDIVWAYEASPSPPRWRNPISPADLRLAVLNSPEVQAAIQAESELKKIDRKKVLHRANQILDTMGATMDMTVARWTAWFLKKIWRRLYTGIHVEPSKLGLVKDIASKYPLVLIPTHRSYIDFLMLSWVFFDYGIPLPHIASGEDFLGLGLVSWILRCCGAFYMRRSFKNDPLYGAIFGQYVEKQTVNGHPLEFFIEGRRSRSGKSLNPKQGILNMTLQPLLKGEVDEIFVLPVSITYEKLVEGELYTRELLGESKVPESLQGLWKARQILNQKFGRITIAMGEPISGKSALAAFQASTGRNPATDKEALRSFMTDLSFRVIRELNANLHITISSLVATFLLNDRKGIDFEQLVEKVRWLQGELLRVGAHIAFEGGTERLCLGALNILGPLVRKRRNMIEPATEQGNISAVLVLSLYRNQVIHIFVDHGMFAVALLSGGEGRPVKQSDLLDKYKFLKRLLNMEFPRFPDPNLTTANQVLNELVDRQVFRWTTVDSEPAYELIPDSAGYVTFLCNLLWPFLESYLVGCLTLLSIRPAVEVEKNALHQRMGWLAERMFEEGRLCFEESCVMDTLDNAIAAFTKLGLISRYQKTIPNKKDKKKTVTKEFIQLTKEYQEGSALMDYVNVIDSYRKLPTNSSKSGLNRELTDFPFLSRL